MVLKISKRFLTESLRQAQMTPRIPTAMFKHFSLNMSKRLLVKEISQ
jgi:hypothetical protein